MVAAPVPLRNGGLFAPFKPTSVDETSVDAGFIADLTLKVLYFNGVITGGSVASIMCLPYNNVVDRVLESLKGQSLVEIRGGTGPLALGYRYALTDKGMEKVRELLERSQYAGPCPVAFDDYCAAVAHQSIKDVVVSRDNINRAFAHMVLRQRVIDQLGPAINSGKSLFLFGPPGNGKTTIAEVASTVLGGHIYIPHAVLIDGQVVRVFDEVHHRTIDDPNAEAMDARWLLSRRPVVVAGGELTLDTLELGFHEEAKVYEAPLQMKANCGMFLIDDFGRQRVQPTDLLNRWIVPLEKQVDYLTLVTGQRVKVPFQQMLVFATNLEPGNLADEAFLRRIRFKLRLEDPTQHQFEELFRRECAARGMTLSADDVRYMLERWWADRPLRMCQPRDVVHQF